MSDGGVSVASGAFSDFFALRKSWQKLLDPFEKKRAPAAFFVYLEKRLPRLQVQWQVVCELVCKDIRLDWRGLTQSFPKKQGVALFELLEDAGVLLYIRAGVQIGRLIHEI